MYPMPMNEARQLVGERRTSLEAIAFRRQFRRFVTHGATPAAPAAVRVLRQGPNPPSGRRDDSAAKVPVCTVA
jgi:hypothetical protein